MIRRLLILLLGAALLGAGWLGYFAFHTRPLPTSPTEFSIKPGSSLKAVADQLHAQGVVDAPLRFVILGRVLGFANRIKAGSYLVDTPMSPYQLLRKITLGEIMLAKITIIEGWTFAQMRQGLDAHPRLRHDSAGMSAEALLQAVAADASHPEGLFFPDTYYFDTGDSDLNLLRRAYHAMRNKLAAEWEGRADGLPYKTPYQALVMASIVEKETGAADERPLIAAVFVNRLRLGMRLQTDPSVIYGLGPRFDGNLRKDDLLADTPYNTYTRAGLPPTPIALPGEAAVHAALHPASSKALYFVAKGGGRHHFSTNLDDHNRAVNRFQRGGG